MTPNMKKVLEKLEIFKSYPFILIYGQKKFASGSGIQNPESGSGSAFR